MNMNRNEYRIAVVSGGFDPLHSGHIDYLESASELGHELVVLLNSDEWLIRKKGTAFLPFAERKAILESLGCRPRVFAHDDSDGSARKGLEDLVSDKLWKETIIFCNGGDRTEANIPEGGLAGVEYAFNVGGEKTESSTQILTNYLNNTASLVTTPREWGHYSVLWQDDSVKVKELVIQPYKGISYQRHFKRSEQWFVSKGSCKVRVSVPTYDINALVEDPDTQNSVVKTIQAEESFTVEAGTWHQIYNETPVPCHIIEIQYGIATEESDIERHSYYRSIEH
jgi:D-beta-D-heptose 7-phosphate kinase/D-beta-D-heptose 1-phosphate adenosyltransferase